ncbi:MAG: hypothetical protein QXJ32_08000 [Thermoplasmata archaeon]
MKTSALLGLIAVLAVVAAAGLVAASGTVSNALGLSDGGSKGQGDGSQMQATNNHQWQYRKQLSEPQQNAAFQNCLEHSYGWSYGSGSGCIDGCGSSCNDYYWNYTYQQPGPHGH